MVVWVDGGRVSGGVGGTGTSEVVVWVGGGRD